MTRRTLLVLAAFLALALPARAGIDYGRMSQPDVMSLLQLVQAEDWEALVARGEPMALKVEQAGDVNGVFFVNQQLWFGYFNLGRTREAARANARSKRAYYRLVKDDPSMAELATIQLANAMVSEGQYEAAVKLVDENLSRPDAQYRDQLAWQKAIALLLTDGPVAAASWLAGDATKAGGFASANEYLLAAEILDAETADRATVKKYGDLALKAFGPFVKPGGLVQAGTRGDGSLLARATAVAGDYAVAIPLYQQYVQLSLKAGQGGKEANQRLRYQLNAVLGLWEDRAGHPDVAIKHYREAVDSLEKTWSKIKVQESKKSFMGQGQPMYVPRPARVYERLMRLLGQKKLAAETLELVESFKSRALADLLARRVKTSTAGADLVAKERKLFRDLEKAQRMNQPSSPALVDEYERVVEDIRKQDDEFAGTIKPLRLKGGAVQKLLDDDTVLLEYFVGQEGTLVWVVTSKSVSVVDLPAGSDEVERLVDAARRVLRKPGQEEKARAALDALSKAVLPKLPPSKRLIVVPHGPLHHIPFAALTQDGKYVVESRAVVHVPSASVLSWCARKNKRPADLSKEPAIAFALGDAKPVTKGWDPLPGTLTEVKGLKGVLPTLKVVQGSALNRDAVQKQAVGARIVHFATHGSFDENEPLDSCLILADGQLTVPEILELPLNSAWSVTLSACQTGLGRVEIGDDVVGLTRAFLYAGTPAVLSTLWKIADEPTAHLMTDYYAGLARGTRSDALRAAQLRSAADPATAHPYFWAAFVITGDWR